LTSRSDRGILPSSKRSSQVGWGYEAEAALDALSLTLTESTDMLLKREAPSVAASDPEGSGAIDFALAPAPGATDDRSAVEA
jgi:hypothetical protein